MQLEPEISYKHTNDWDTAKQWLSELPDLAAFDFEAASIYSDEDRAEFKRQLEEDTLTVTEQIEVNAKLNSDALSHPYYTVPTHLSVGWSDKDAFVIVMDNDDIRFKVIDWLVTTDITQIWHNFLYDGKIIYFWSQGQQPKNIEDTALFAKCLLNHVDTWKANVQLKQLMGYRYGSWAVSSDYFDLKQIYNEKLIRYAAIDACATYALWEEINKQLEG